MEQDGNWDERWKTETDGTTTTKKETCYFADNIRQWSKSMWNKCNCAECSVVCSLSHRPGCLHHQILLLQDVGIV